MLFSPGLCCPCQSAVLCFLSLLCSLFSNPFLWTIHALLCVFWKGAFSAKICVCWMCGIYLYFPHCVAMKQWSFHSNCITYLFSDIWRKFPHRFSLSPRWIQIQILFVLSWSIASWGSISYCVVKFTCVPSYMRSVDWFRQPHGLLWRYAKDTELSIMNHTHTMTCSKCSYYPTLRAPLSSYDRWCFNESLHVMKIINHIFLNSFIVN